MKLPNWIMLCALLVGAMGQYSVSASTIVPAFSGDFSALSSAATAARSNAPSEAMPSPVNINEANADELSVLPGIGAKKALAIVAYRELNGKFMSVEELVNVKGIGPKMLAKLSGYVSVQ